MTSRSPNRAARGAEGNVSDGLDGAQGFARSAFAALLTARDLIDGRAASVAVASCVLDVSINAEFADVDLLLEAALRHAVRNVIVAHPLSLGIVDVSAREVFDVLAACGVHVFGADRGWISADDFDALLESDGLPSAPARAIIKLGGRP